MHLTGHPAELMNVSNQRLIILSSLALAAMTVPGCRPQYPPSEEGVIDYLRKAALIHHDTGASAGKVRRLWPAGQEYVTNVTRANAKLNELLKPLRTLDSPFALPAAADPQWSEKQAVLDRMTELASLVKANAPARAAAHKKLVEAVEKTPKGIGLEDKEAKADFVDSVWEALAAHSTPIQDGEQTDELESIGAQYLELYSVVHACADKADTTTTGLAFTDEECTEKVSGLHEQLRERLETRQMAAIDADAEGLMNARDLMVDVDKKNKRREYEYLIAEEDYYEVELEHLLKMLQAKIAATTEAAEDARSAIGSAEGDEQKKLEAKAAFLESRERVLSKQLEAWHERFTPLLKPERAEEPDVIPEGE